MLGLQDSMNGRINKAWREEGNPWEDAIFTEAVEAFNHTYWEWWKNQGKQPNFPQIKLEIVDIWHFILSEMLNHEIPEDYTYFDMVTALVNFVKENRPSDYVTTPVVIREALKNLVRAALGPKDENHLTGVLTTFIIVMDVLEMSWAELYKLYIGKNTLNQFRQANGYKTDTQTYKSIWEVAEKGKEDNDYLTENLKILDVNSETFKDDITMVLSGQFAVFKDIYEQQKKAAA